MTLSTTLELAERVGRISASSTMKVAAEADRLRREGVDVVDFSAGEPDFPTPENIKQAAIRAIEKNFTKYTPPANATSSTTAPTTRPPNASSTSAASTASSV
jgi:aspartate/methionine/tyrosine aminotransferase